MLTQIIIIGLKALSIMYTMIYVGMIINISMKKDYKTFVIFDMATARNFALYAAAVYTWLI